MWLYSIYLENLS